MNRARVPHFIALFVVSAVLVEWLSLISQGGPGYTGPPLIELDGTFAGGTADGFAIFASGCTIKGLSIVAFNHSGISMFGGVGSNTIQGCYIGIDADGVTPVANGIGVDIGITIDGFASDAIQVLDVTDPYAVQELTGYITKQESGGCQVSINVPGNGYRSLLALGKDRPGRVAAFSLDTPSNLRDRQQGADLLISRRGAAKGAKRRSGGGMGIIGYDIRGWSVADESRVLSPGIRRTRKDRRGGDEGEVGDVRRRRAKDMDTSRRSNYETQVRRRKS